MRSYATLASAVAAGVLFAGCSSADLSRPEETGRIPRFGATVPLTPGDGSAFWEEFEVCKYGSSASFSYTVFNRNDNSTSSGGFSLTDGQCIVVAAVGGKGADVTVTETGAQSGFQLDRVEVTTLVDNVSTETTESGPGVTGFVSGSAGGTIPLRGVLAEFYNEPVEVAGECEGKVTQLTLRYLGSADPALVQVFMKGRKKQPGTQLFSGGVTPGGEFTFVGADRNGTMGTDIFLDVNGVRNTSIHTSCSQPIGPGLVRGDFLVVQGYSRLGGLLPPL